MRELLTAAGYEQTKQKLANLKARLAKLEERTDLNPAHLAGVRRSYEMMMREYLQNIRLYEAQQRKQNSADPQGLTTEAYEQAKEKLADLEGRLAAVEKRTDLSPERLARIRRSYEMIMRGPLQDIEHYEAVHTKRNTVEQT